MSVHTPLHALDVGGPERLSRLDMALKVADAYNFDKSESIIPVPSDSVSRGVASPADISMDVSRLRMLEVPLTFFSEALTVVRDNVLKVQD